MKILTVIGARPQFIKAATISRALLQRKSIQEVIVHTGQHYDENMSEVFFRDLEIPKPHYHLGVGGGGHGAMTGKMLEGIEQILLKHRPDAVLVYGDTNSTLAGALAAAKLHIPVAHVEAGLRSFNKQMPEEINRILTDHVSEWLFCPTETAVQNLKTEGVLKNVHLVGDVMYDAALFYAGRTDQLGEIVPKLVGGAQPFCLATIHRAENTDHPERLTTIFNSLDQLSREISVLLPLHPRTRATLGRIMPGFMEKSGIRFIDPVGYLEMIALEKEASVVVTDSGGVQKEAFFFRTPCVTLRDQTEWVELVDIGWNRLVPPRSSDEILNAVESALAEKPSEPSVGLYGGGTAAAAIIGILEKIAQG